MATLSFRDQMGVMTCLVLGTRDDQVAAVEYDDVVREEIAGAIVTLTDLPMVERIAHAFEAQRITVSKGTILEIVKTLFYDGLRDAAGQRVAA